ncbi:TAXI family TRAP transporter solute-binding subunit [Neobacillus niacini]|uniref:TAXI family TRAP transporter solute-binding subunit n=1 Tax=Neobacillus niacini TaxID=86668 RepID=UPI0021CB535D|nr:TAXI family TRAP transporter solute-binding subunit [Neobacillus niacini]MCM3766370.1 TAXI family TRAP transporter solute-binding subunit [Neobacillus niacini]
MKQKSKFRWYSVFMLVVVLSLMIAGCGSDSSSGSKAEKASGANGGPVKLKVATNNIQTSWYQFSSALSEILKKTSPAIDLEVLPIAGGTGNVDLIEQGEADFALMHNVASNWAFNGEVAFDKKHENLRGLVGGVNDYYIGIIARTEFLKKNGIDSLADIKEKKIPTRVITNPVGTLAEYSTRLTLEAYGLDYKAIEKLGGSVELTSNDVIKSAFQNGKADIHILVMTKAHPVITELALSTDITLMAMEDNIMDSLGKYGFEADKYPSGQFKNQDYEVNTVGFVASYVTDKNLDEELAYTITKAIVENKEALVKGHSSVQDFDPAKAADEILLGVPLHPGAKRYYEEVGILK